MKKPYTIIVRALPAKKGRWEIYASRAPKAKKAVTFTAKNGTTYTGFFEFGTRLIAKNGNLICGNLKQFNAIAGAVKNINAVKNSA